MAKRRRLAKPFKIVFIILGFAIVTYVAFTIIGKLRNDSVLKFPNEVTEIEYGSEFDPVSLRLSCAGLEIEADCDMVYPTVDTKKIGDTKYDFVVKIERRETVIKHTIRVVDKDNTANEKGYRIISLDDFSALNNQELLDNILNESKDNIKKITITVNYQDNLELNTEKYTSIKQFTEQDLKAGIYEVVFDIENNKRIKTNKEVTFLYQLSPDNMSEPYRFSYKSKKYILANKWVPLPKDYNPGLDAVTQQQMATMLADMKKEGINIKIVSGFRSYDLQESIYNKYVKDDGLENASRYSARAGYSEHQTGLTLDIGKLHESFADTKAFSWLQQHANEYGFIMRYPLEKEGITGYMFEPWHYRFLGVELATAVKKTNLTLEEFIGYIHLP